MQVSNVRKKESEICDGQEICKINPSKKDPLWQYLFDQPRAAIRHIDRVKQKGERFGAAIAHGRMVRQRGQQRGRGGGDEGGARRRNAGGARDGDGACGGGDSICG
jgi:hypothetical protein